MSEQTEMRIKNENLSIGRKNLLWEGTLAGCFTVPRRETVFLEGKDYIVTWGLGHLVTLKDPEGYDKKYKEWKMEENFRLCLKNWRKRK